MTEGVVKREELITAEARAKFDERVRRLRRAFQDKQIEKLKEENVAAMDAIQAAHEQIYTIRKLLKVGLGDHISAAQNETLDVLPGEPSGIYGPTQIIDLVLRLGRNREQISDLIEKRIGNLTSFLTELNKSNIANNIVPKRNVELTEQVERLRQVLAIKMAATK